MTTSGTYNFNPSLADLTLEAFSRIGLQPKDLTQTHLISARRSLNYALTAWANKGILLWGIDLQTISLVAGTEKYALPPETVSILDTYVVLANYDRILTPLSRTEYAQLSQKLLPSEHPTGYWFERHVIPNIYVWPVQNQAMTLKYYRMRRLQDAALSANQQADVPFRFLEALVSDVTARLAQKFAPPLYQSAKADAMMAFGEAFDEDRERVGINITPDLSSYWRV